MSVVVDASVVVAALIDSGPLGEWAEGVLTSDTVLAPHLMPAEVSNILRRAGVAGDIPADAATLAHVDLGELAAELFAYEPLAQRIWDLRHNLTAYDAWYVALAEQVGAELATLDRRLARAPGPTCGFLLPP